MWKFQFYSATQILREINFDHFEAPETVILTIWAALNFEFLGISDTYILSSVKVFPKFKIQSLQIVKMCSFWPSEMPQNWFHINSEWQENSHAIEYPQSRIPIKLPRSVMSRKRQELWCQRLNFCLVAGLLHN